ncbi:hypothetical protein BHE74_00021267 [Ensete ventricosum]|nr:hypothetical protein GW17_00018573 [Ensete ventricosum]RWW71022.1 hypothetical protein BHE74_00021267 [Ensete ventricosum]RZS00071.1 hypothetical protein BHM03_00029719 [Ensete ventricosum]
MEVTMSMGSLVRLPTCNPKGALLQEDARFFLRGSPLASDKTGNKRQQRRRNLLVVEAKGKRGMMAGRQFQRPPPPRLPKIEDDGNPRFVVFVRTSNAYDVLIWLPTQEELKTVLDKVKDFFGNATSGAKESFGKLTSLGSLTDEESESQSE